MRIISIVFAFLFPMLALALPAELDAAIDSLDVLLQKQPYFMQRRNNEIDSMKSGLKTLPAAARVLEYKRLADSYRLLNIDSALYYYDLALQNVADTASADFKRIIWAKSSIMPVSGLLHEGRELYENYPPGVADSAYMAEYYANGVDLYLYIIDFISQPEYRKLYGRMAMELNDSLLALLPPESKEYGLRKAYRYIYDRQYPLAVGELNELLKRLQPTENMYARVHAILADYYSGEGRDEEAIYHLVMAAAGDVQAATQEFTALTRLGMNLYKRGDVDRAYRYLMLALESSVKAGSRLRTLENAQSLPMISQSFRDRDHARTVWLVVAMTVLSVALAVIIVMMVLMRRKQKDVDNMQSRLRDNVQLKDAYIGQVLSMCSLYIERMEEFNRLAGRKIKAGQVQDLYHMIESGKILQEQAVQFYEVFDKAFFGIYPDFVDRVNELLQPDRRIVLPAPGRLTPESRILAFMRLGIDDSAQLSKFLGLSLNTIYTYRNKLKSRALNRESFESDVREIGQIR